MNRSSAAVAALGAAVLLGLAYVGNFHFVYGANVPVNKVPKVSWSLSETVVNWDELNNLPAIVARSKYPLFLLALEKRGAEAFPQPPQ